MIPSDYQFTLSFGIISIDYQIIEILGPIFYWFGSNLLHSTSTSVNRFQQEVFKVIM